MSDIASEIGPVLKGNYCVGCGACAVASPNGVEMRKTASGAYQAVIKNHVAAAETKGNICPFSDNSPTEDDHGERLFPDAPHQNNQLGRFEGTYAGSVKEGKFRQIGSSGGMTSWIATELLRQGKIDAVIHVHEAEPNIDNALFKYDISQTVEEIQNGAKTRYYSVNMAEALIEILSKDLKFAFIGVPCFVKAIRNLALSDPEIDKRVKYTIAIICGHMKAAGFAESLSWQIGVPPANIKTVDFRVKLPARSANNYGFSATDKQTLKTTTRPMQDLAGRRWDGGYFKLKACEFCDDVVGETADVSLGDAWLPEYNSDSQGTNVIIVRSPIIKDMIEQAKNNGRLNLDRLDANRAALSQAAGFRDRREALSYRLWLTDKSNKWRPNKRVQPDCKHIPYVRRLIYRLRQWVRVRSFKSYYLSKKLGLISPYILEMTLYHACLKLITLFETRLTRHEKKRAASK